MNSAGTDSPTRVYCYADYDAVIRRSRCIYAERARSTYQEVKTDAECTATIPDSVSESVHRLQALYVTSRQLESARRPLPSTDVAPPSE